MKQKRVTAVLIVGLLIGTTLPQSAFAENNENQTRQELKDIKEEKDEISQTVKKLEEKIAPQKKKVIQLEKDIAKTNKKIAEAEKKQEENKDQLKHYDTIFKKRVRTMYQHGEMGSMRALLEAKSLGDFLDRFETLRLLLVRDRTLLDKYEKIHNDQAKLKKKLKSLSKKQKEEAEETRKIYEKVNKEIAKAQQELSTLTQKEESVRRALQHLTLVSPSLYPYRYASVAGVDSWGFYNRQCTSFVAWRMNQRGIRFTNTMGGGRWSNATNWDNNARRLGFRVDRIPRAGAIAQWKAGAGGHGRFGHVAFVKSVNGSLITIEEYNFNPRFGFSTRTIPAYSVSNFIHVN